MERDIRRLLDGTRSVSYEFPGGKQLTWEGSSCTPLGHQASTFGVEARHVTRIGRSLATTVAWMILADAWVRGPAARAAEFRIGITGLDTSHATAFTKAFNFAEPALEGMRVVAAQGIEIVESIAAVLERSDGVLLETNDGRLGTFRGMRPLSAGRR